MNRSRFWILSLAGILAAAGATAADVRYVTIDIPKESATLSLAEVEVITKDGKNIARQGAATQSSTANNGNADRAIDGRTDHHHPLRGKRALPRLGARPQAGRAPGPD